MVFFFSKIKNYSWNVHSEILTRILGLPDEMIGSFKIC